MPPRRLIRKLMAHELSAVKKSKKKTNAKKAKGSASVKKKTSRAPSTKKKVSSVRSKAKNTKKAGNSPEGKATSSKSAATTTSRSLSAASGNWAVGANNLEGRVESSPNGRAKCRFCDQLIRVGQSRIAICRASRILYYHERCLPEKDGKALPQQFRDKLSRRLNQRIMRDKILLQRSGLVSVLRANYRFLSDECINRLAITLPKSPIEVFQICETAFDDFFYGEDEELTCQIHQDIRKYLEPPLAAEILRRQQANSSPEVIVIDDSDNDANDIVGDNTKAANASTHNHGDDDSDDDEIACEETLTCAQVVQQKFDRAAANGEVVAID